MAMNIDAAVNISADVSGQQAVDKLSASLKKMGDQGQLSAAQIQQSMRYLPKQFDDAFRSLAAGQAPMNVLLTQGSQLRDMFGGIVPAIRAVGTMLGGILTPLNLVLAALGGVAFAAYKGRSEFDDLTNKLALTGNAAGYSAGQIEKMAKTLSSTAGISAGAARDLATGLATSGQFVGKNLDIAEQAAARVQKMTGQTADEVVKDFSNMSKGVANWAAEHNRSYNYLTAAEFQHIKRLEDMGDKEGAMRANMDALNKAFKDRTQQLGTIETAWKNIAEWASKGWQAMLNIGKPETNEDKLEGLRKQLTGIDALASRPLVASNGGQPANAEYQQRRESILEQMRLLQKGIDKAETERLEKARAAAKEREKIEEIQSGKLSALQNSDIQLKLEKAQGASDEEIAILEQKGQRIENQYRAGLMTEEQYNAEKLRIAKAILDERMKLAEKEMALEGSRPVNSKVDVAQQQVKLQALRNQLAQLGAQSTQAELKAEGERAAFLKKTNDELIKFSTTQTNHIAQIIAEADAADMSTLEYKKHTEALRIDKEAADAMIGKAPEAQKAIKDQADAFKDATAAALDYAYNKSRTFEAGAQSAIKDYVENVNNGATQMKTLFTDAFKGMEDALVSFVKTGKLDFSNLADSIITDMIRITVQRQILSPLMGTGQNGDFGVMGSVFSGLKSIFSANGNVMTAGGPLPLNTYANGGIATRPQLSIFGEGKTPEAYVPLPDGRSIPVSMRGGGGGANVTVNVVNNSNAKATAQERQDSNGNRIIDVFIEQVKASIAGDISRGVGTVTSALERTYGANRAAGAY